jgi:ribose 1,5-bisphosphokinase PhnN
MNDAAQAVMAIGFFGSIAVTVRAVAAVLVQRYSRRDALPVEAIEQRLARIEEAVDVIAVEVERIAESQRFMARLASEGERVRLPVPGRSSEGRVITPH